MSIKCIKYCVRIIAVLVCATTYINVAQAKHLMVYGDSLSAAYGLELNQGWVSLLAEDLGANHQVSNASISGETSIGGLARLPETLRQLNPDIVFIELGANDGLRGYPIARIKQNIGTMIDLVKASNAQAVLAGISIPASYGPRYVDQFRSLYIQLAEEHEIPFINLYLEEFVTTPGLIQADGLHPTAIGQPLIRDSVISFFSQLEILD